jgi:hypothetical protein
VSPANSADGKDCVTIGNEGKTTVGDDQRVTMFFLVNAQHHLERQEGS